MDAKKKVFLGHFRSFKKKCKKNANKVMVQKKKHGVLFALLSTQPPKKVKKMTQNGTLCFLGIFCATICQIIPNVSKMYPFITKKNMKIYFYNINNARIHMQTV
jgi:hypothetical protein